MTGRAIRNLELTRDSLIVATKVYVSTGPGPNNQGLTRKHVLQQVEASLRRLQTDYIDLYQIHGYDPLTPLDETLRVLDDLVRSGKVRYLGASNLAAWQLMKALGHAAQHRLHQFKSLQAYYTVANRELERELVPLLQDQRVGLTVWSPLAGGLLSGKYPRAAGQPGGGRRDHLDFPLVDQERAYRVLDVLTVLAAKKGATVAQLALAWLLHQPTVTSVIVGATRLAQLEENLGAVDVLFTEAELEQLSQASQLPLEYPGWMLQTSSALRTVE
jgi:aryl-alcohol dehydrogenase-like predicted oxidoreductase